MIFSLIPRPTALYQNGRHPYVTYPPISWLWIDPHLQLRCCIYGVFCLRLDLLQPTRNANPDSQFGQDSADLGPRDGTVQADP